MAIVFASIYGLSDEIHQAFVPSRIASGWDFLADFLGSIWGPVCIWTFLAVKNESLYSNR
jgi:VanZ family protein